MLNIKIASTYGLPFSRNDAIYRWGLILSIFIAYSSVSQLEIMPSLTIGRSSK